MLFSVSSNHYISQNYFHACALFTQAKSSLSPPPVPTRVMTKRSANPKKPMLDGADEFEGEEEEEEEGPKHKKARVQREEQGDSQDDEMENKPVHVNSNRGRSSKAASKATTKAITDFYPKERLTAGRE